MKTFREIAEMHYGSEPVNNIDKQCRENRINALEKLLTDQFSQYNVSGRSEQLICTYCGINPIKEKCPHPKKCSDKKKVKAN